MANFFDQFDSEQSSGNFFDRFDDEKPRQMDFRRSKSEIRGDIEKLPEAERTQAYKDWAKFRLDNPSDGADALRQRTTRGSAVGRGFLGGSYLDEIGAGIDAGLYGVTGGYLGAPYDEGVAIRREAVARDNAENPLLSLVEGIGGGVISGGPIASRYIGNAGSKLGKIVRGGVAGTTGAYVYGTGQGEGSIENRHEAGKELAPIGAAFGLGLPIAGAIGGAAINQARHSFPALRSRLPGGNPEKIAEDMLAARIDRAGARPQAIQRDLNQGQDAARLDSNSRAYLPEMIADTSRDLGRFTGSVYRQGGEAGEIVSKALTERQHGTGNRYSRVQDDSLPSQREQMLDASERAMLIKSKDTGRQTQKAIEQKQQQDATDLYNKAWSNQKPFDIGKPISAYAMVARQHTGPFRRTLEEAMSYFKDPWGGSSMTLQRFDAAKQQLDDMIEASMENYKPTSLTRRLVQLKNMLLDEVHGVDQKGNITRNAEYAKARDVYSSAAENREAIELGRTALNDDSAVSVADFNGLSTGQKQLFRLGLQEALESKLSRKRSGNDATLLFQEPRTQELLREVIPGSQKKSDVFYDRSGRFGEVVRRQSRIGSTNKTVLGNSMTQERAMDDADFNAGALRRIGQMARGGADLVLESVATVLSRIGGFKQPVAVELAKRLTSTDPATQQRILTQLSSRMGRKKIDTLMREIDRLSGPAARVSAQDNQSE